MIYISVCIIIKKKPEKFFFHGFSSKFLLKIFAFEFPIFYFGNLRWCKENKNKKVLFYYCKILSIFSVLQRFFFKSSVVSSRFHEKILRIFFGVFLFLLTLTWHHLAAFWVSAFKKNLSCPSKIPSLFCTEISVNILLQHTLGENLFSLFVFVVFVNWKKVQKDFYTNKAKKKFIREMTNEPTAICKERKKNIMIIIISLLKPNLEEKDVCTHE